MICQRLFPCLVDTEPYFLRCCRYSEMNPVRARMVDDPAHYRWSSYSHHAHGVTADLLLSQHEQYARLGLTDEARQSAYRALFHMQLDTQVLSESRDPVHRGWPLGSERFKDESARALRCAARPPKRGRAARAQASSQEPQSEPMG